MVARLQVGEALHLRLVCAQATTGSAVSFASEATGAVLPFYVFASDGISYAQPVRKTLLVVGVGQREGVLVRFAVPGRVLIMQGIINDFQGTGGGQGPGPNSTDRVAAYIDVVAASQPGLPTGPPLEQLQFTPGMGNATIAPADIGAQLGVRFEVNSDLSRVPSPQFVIGGRPFDYKAITATLPARGAAQWTVPCSPLTPLARAPSFVSVLCGQRRPSPCRQPGHAAARAPSTLQPYQRAPI